MSSVFDNIEEFERNRPTFEQQDPKRQMVLIKNTINMMTATSSIFVIRISAAELKRLKSEKTHEHDPLKTTLSNLDSIFATCKASKVDVDVSASADAMLEAYERDKKSNGAIFLAWEIDQRLVPRANPECVAIAVCTELVSHSDFSTSQDSMSASDYEVLQPLFGKNLLLDTLCSKKRGCGRILTLHCYLWAHIKKYDGLLALSYSKWKLSNRVRPASEKMFRDLGFEPIIEQADFQTAMYGIWFMKRINSLDGLNAMIVSLCSRAGLSQKSARSLVWRCPN